MKKSLKNSDSNLEYDHELQKKYEINPSQYSPLNTQNMVP